jgi:two-component system sensor histidine kinase DegS
VHDLTGRRELERQILKAAANEQRRIGQDLHDSLCQDLVGIAFALDHAQRALPDEAAVAKSLRELLQ